VQALQKQVASLTAQLARKVGRPEMTSGEVQAWVASTSAGMTLEIYRCS
jgi:hypothetical protein